MARFDPMQAELDNLEGRMVACRMLYEQYFLGIEKREPTQHRDEITRSLREFEKRLIINTAVKFRLQMLRARWTTYSLHWGRICKQIEDGTYRPHRIKAELREKIREQERRRNADRAARKQAREGNGGAQAPVNGAGNGGAAPRAGGALDKLHDQYSKARAQTGESAVDKDRLSQVVKQQAQAIKKKYKCKSVEFRVVIENGKAKLKAVPKN